MSQVLLNYFLLCTSFLNISPQRHQALLPTCPLLRGHVKCPWRALQSRCRVTTEMAQMSCGLLFSFPETTLLSCGSLINSSA